MKQKNARPRVIVFECDVTTVLPQETIISLTSLATNSIVANSVVVCSHGNWSFDAILLGHRICRMKREQS